MSRSDLEKIQALQGKTFSTVNPQNWHHFQIAIPSK